MVGRNLASNAAITEVDPDLTFYLNLLAPIMWGTHMLLFDLAN